MYTWNFHEKTYEPFTLLGTSVAGIHTCFIIPELKVCFDVAQGLPFALNMRDYLITHSHMDHASGIPYIISQKALTSQPPARFYMPPNMVGPLEKIMTLWSELENHQYNYEFIAVEADKEYPLKGNYFFKIFPTLHRVPSNGYTIFERKKKLKPELQNKNGAEIAERRRRGEIIEDEITEAIFSFTGDAKIEFLDQVPWLKNCRYLMMETTYVDEKKSVDEARKWGHIHLDELYERLPELNCEKIILIHLSSRYKVTDTERILDQRVDPKQRHKIEVFPIK